MAAKTGSKTWFRQAKQSLASNGQVARGKPDRRANAPFGDEPFLQTIETLTRRKCQRNNWEAELRASGLILSLDSLRSALD